MSSRALIRLAGLAAILAGAFRTAAAFGPQSQPSAAYEWFYLAIDILLVFGLLGIYSYQHTESGLWGLVGFLLAAAGLESIGGPDGTIGDVDVYRAGASLIGVGMVVLAVGTWRAGKLPREVPVLWVLSTAIGLSGFGLVEPGIAFLIAGVAFGLGFIRAGVRMWSDRGLRGTGWR